MARPRKDQEGPSAVERMEGAFWDCLEEKPYPDITVADIVGRAGVNRNAFYYHFENMAALARRAVGDTLPVEVLSSLVPRIRHGMPPAEVMLDPVYERKFTCLRRVVGPHSSPELVGTIRDLMFGNWLSMFGLEPTDLTEEERLGVMFAANGMIGVIGDERAFEDDPHPLERLWESPVISQALPLVPAVFERAAARKAAGGR